MRLLRRAVFFSLLPVAGWSSTLYSDGPVNTTVGGNLIYNIFSISDSFVISSNATATMVSNLGLWVIPGDTPNTLSWVISTAPDGGGTVEGSGSGVALSTSFFGSTAGNRNSVFSASFSLGSVPLSAGTYYLELFNATVTANNGDEVFWNSSTGSSIADQKETGFGIMSIAPDAFEIDGNTTGGGGTPEPASVVLFGIGLATLAGMALLRRRQFQG